MKTELKINRKFLIFLMYLEVSKRKIAELFGVSTRSLFTYLQNFPVSESEFAALQFDRESLEQFAMNCFTGKIENVAIQKSFRLPETKFGVRQNTIQKHKESLPEKIKQKSSSPKSVKKEDETTDTKINALAQLSALNRKTEEEIKRNEEEFN